MDMAAPPSMPTVPIVLVLVSLSDPIKQNKNIAQRVVIPEKKPSIPFLFRMPSIVASFSQVKAWLRLKTSGIEA
eukprot:CAMPEP_0182509462 /NCGR_PEP_ID=MMETSP1321-20130603/26899_1 /TAXON_ID=91990 /ORGANISM="Bolidomonas sp., Strain RCC1657" /LENGTH=73 /DNA_ID=CAMNT_0024715739 /DNA_START=30 /DNA_END=248 /DNA_ORIENTATION=-